jgi:2-dehydropantoate 2-reductase
MSRIAVLGPGGVGGFVAAALARAGSDVLVVARAQTVSAIGQHGLRVRSVALGDFSAQPAVAERLVEPAGALLVATKAAGLGDALERIEVPPDLVIPLLNGVEHMQTLRERFGPERVVASVIRIESDRRAPDDIVQSSPGARVDIAEAGPDARRRVAPLAQALQAAGLEVRLGGSEAQVLWAKLARLNALALTTSASERPLGFVRSDPRWRSALEGAVSETVAVANAEGAELEAEATLAELDQAHAGLGSSMQRDIAEGREPELDAIAGAVLRAAARHRLSCPTVSWLAGRVAERARIPAPVPVFGSG